MHGSTNSNDIANAAIHNYIFWVKHPLSELFNSLIRSKNKAVKKNRTLLSAILSKLFHY